MNRNIPTCIESSADSPMTQMGEENAAAIDERDCLRLTDGEFEAICERLAEVDGIHAEMNQALDRFDELIRVLATGTPTAREIDALKGLLLAHEARVSEASDLWDGIQQALEGWPLDDLSRLLNELVTHYCECDFSKPVENQ